VSVPVQGNISANEASTLLRATLAGAGVAMLPTYQAGVHVHAGELVRLLPMPNHADEHLRGVRLAQAHAGGAAQHAGFSGATVSRASRVGYGKINGSSYRGNAFKCRSCRRLRS
jgi:hypothetical protein